MDKFSLEEMRNFFNKRELVSFSISNGNHKIPKKRNFLRTRTSSSEDAESTYETLPNGEFHRLKRVEISKGKNMDDSTTIREFKYRRGLLHGRHSSKKNIGNRTFTSKENSEKESLMEPFFFIETGLFRRVARSSKERRSKVLWTLSQRRQQYFVETRKRSTTSQGQENLEFLPLSFASRRKRFWVEKF